jgi:hypothetical protein
MTEETVIMTPAPGNPPGAIDGRTFAFNNTDDFMHNYRDAVGVGTDRASAYSHINTSYSGVDGLPIFVTSNSSIVMNNMVTLSYSIHANKIPVRVLGRRNPKGYTFGCIKYDEMICTDHGYKRAENICVDDKILSVNLENNELSYEKCARVFKKGIQKCYDVILNDGSKMSLTENHKVYTNNGWKLVRDLDKADMLYVPNGYDNNIDVKNLTLSFIQFREKNYIGEHETYDFEVENNHNLFGMFLSHNSRTISGTMIFIAQNKHPLADLIANSNTSFANADHLGMLADEIEPFDIIVRYTNEYGYFSYFHLYRVEFIEEGQATSSNDLAIEYQFQYVAYDVDVMTAFNSAPLAGDITSDANLSILFSQIWGNDDIDANFSAGLLPVTGGLYTTENNVGTDGELIITNDGVEQYNMQTRRDLINKWADPHTYPGYDGKGAEFQEDTDETTSPTQQSPEIEADQNPPVSGQQFEPDDTVDPSTLPTKDSEVISINRYIISKDVNGSSYLYWEINGFISKVAIFKSTDKRPYYISTSNRGRTIIQSGIPSGTTFILNAWKYNPDNINTSTPDLTDTVVF